MAAISRVKKTYLPWLGFLLSFLCHLVILGVLIGGSHQKQLTPIQIYLPVQQSLVTSSIPQQNNSPPQEKTSSKTNKRRHRNKRAPLKKKKLSSQQAPSHSTSAILESTDFVGLTPQYPWRSIQRGEEGTVQVGLWSLTSGDLKIKLNRSSGYKRLDEAAMQAVKDYSFHSLFNGLNTHVVIHFVFSLRETY